MKHLAPIILSIFFGLIAIASPKVSLVGYQKTSKTITRELQGSIQRVSESDKQFEVMIGINAAFYLLPMDKNATTIRTQLESLQKIRPGLKLWLTRHS